MTATRSERLMFKLTGRWSDRVVEERMQAVYDAEAPAKRQREYERFFGSTDRGDMHVQGRFTITYDEQYQDWIASINFTDGSGASSRDPNPETAFKGLAGSVAHTLGWIDPKDLRISSGGNTVRIDHIPSGIVVHADSRSQAMQKLYKHVREWAIGQTGQ